MDLIRSNCKLAPCPLPPPHTHRPIPASRVHVCLFENKLLDLWYNGELTATADEPSGSTVLPFLSNTRRHVAIAVFLRQLLLLLNLSEKKINYYYDKTFLIDLTELEMMALLGTVAGLRGHEGFTPPPSGV